MKPLCRIAAAGAAVLLMTAPALIEQANAQQIYGNGGAYTNIWSSAQGTANSYGAANAFSSSSSGSMVTAAGQGLSSLPGFNGGGITSAFTTSTAGTSSNGAGYAQAQTSGYGGGQFTGNGGLSH